MRKFMVLFAALAFPAIASLMLFQAGVRVEFAEAIFGVPPQRISVSSLAKDDAVPPPDWREWAYLAANPDVAEAVHGGAFVSGYQHYLAAGKEEGRTGGFSAAGRKPREKRQQPPPTPIAPAPIAPAPTPAPTPPPPTMAAAAPPPPPPLIVVPPPAAVAPLPAPPIPSPIQPPISAVIPAVIPAAKPPPPAAPVPAPATGGARTNSAAVTGVRFGRHEGFARIVIDSDGPLQYRTETVGDGRSLVVHLPQTSWRGATAGRVSGAPPLASFEAKATDGQETLLTLRGAAPMTMIYAGRFPPSQGAGHRLVVDVAARR